MNQYELFDKLNREQREEFHFKFSDGGSLINRGLISLHFGFLFLAISNVPGVEIYIKIAGVVSFISSFVYLYRAKKRDMQITKWLKERGLT